MSASASHNRSRVLIVDTEPLARWALAHAFASEGVETCAVSAPLELLDRLMSSSYDLVVSASRFDDEDAIAILRGIALARPDMRVIVLGGPEDVAAAGTLPANLVIVEQPFAVADLLRIAGYAASRVVAPL